MKTLALLFSLLFFLSVSSSAIAQAEATEKADPFVKGDSKEKEQENVFETDSEANEHVNIGAMVQFIDVSRDTWSQWRRKNGLPTHGDTLREAAGKWLDSGEALLVETGLAMSRPGQRADLQSIRELIYPTMMHAYEGVSLFPNVYDTRNLGLEFEFDPVLEPGDIVNISYSPSITRYEGENPPTEDPRLPGEDMDVRWPEFYRQQVNGSLRSNSGTWNLIGTETPVIPERRESHRTLIFLKPLLHRFETEKQKEANEVAGPEGSGLNSRDNFLSSAVDEVTAPSDGNLVCEWMETSHEQLNDWLTSREEFGTLVGGGLRTLFQEAIEKGEATLRESRVVRFRSGHRTKNESVTEYRYPTEYDPPKGEQLSNPSAMECRHVGVTVEADMIYGPGGKVAEVNIAPELVSYVGRSVHHRLEIDGMGVPNVTTPVFYLMKPTTSMTIPIDVPVLVGVMTPPDTEGQPDPSRKVVLFLTVTH